MRGPERIRALGLIVALAACPVIGRSQGTPPISFESAVSYPVTGRPSDLAIEDLDADGAPDIATVSFASSAVSLLRGNGDGTFVRIADVTTIGEALGVTAGNFDADTLPDLVVTQVESDFMWFLRNLGMGTFAAPVAIDSGHDPWGVIDVDFDADGKLDLVQVLNAELGGRINVLYGNGNGTFGVPIGTRARGGNRAVVAVDFNNDGQLDAATANGGRATVSVMLGCTAALGCTAEEIANGEIEPQIESPLGNMPGSLAAGLVDDDAFVDVVAPSAGMHTLTFSAGLGDGRFEDPRHFPVDELPSDVELADFDGDGNLDAVVSSGDSSSSVSVLLGNGKGSFARARSYLTGLAPFSIAVADLNDDSHPDVVTVEEGSAGQPTATVLLGSAEGLAAARVLDPYSPADATAVADVDNDGLPDLLTGHARERAVALNRSRSEGFAEAETVLVGGTPEALAVVDADRDGWVDAVVAVNDSSSSNGLFLLPNRQGRLGSRMQIATDRANELAVLDFDGDRILDLAALSRGTGEVFVLRGAGDGTYSRTGAAAVTTPIAFAGGDFDRDGRGDLAVAQAGGSISLLLGKADAIPRVDSSVPAGGTPAAIIVFDANADRNDDLAVARAGGSAATLLGNGEGGFAGGVEIGGLRSPSQPVACDFNGDGRPDLAFAESGFATAAIVANTGNGFAAPVRLPITSDTHHLGAADFDADGDYELIASGLRAVVATNLAATTTRGDGNRDGRLSAADFVPLRQSGSDTRIAVERTAANEIDVNGDGRIDPQDERSLARRIFEGLTT